MNRWEGSTWTDLEKTAGTLWAGFVSAIVIMVCEITGTTKDRMMSWSEDRLSVSQELFIT